MQIFDKIAGMGERGDLVVFALYAISALILAFAIAPLVINVLYSLKFRQMGKIEVDSKISDRKRTIGTPVMGGFIIIITVLFILFVSGISFNTNFGVPMLILLVGGALLGFLSDFFDLKEKAGMSSGGIVYEKVNPLLYQSFFAYQVFRLLTLPFRWVDGVASYKTGMRSSIKFFLELLIVGIAMWLLQYGFHYSLDVVWVPFLGDVVLGNVLGTNVGVGVAMGFDVFVIVAFANAFSWTDGIDAISAGNHAIAFAFLGVLAYLLGNSIIALVCAVVVGAELSFYYFNIPPARIEMSDVGTIPLGLLFGFIAILLNRTLISPIIGFVFFIEIMSSILQIISFKFFKRFIFRMAPLHHHFELVGWSKEKIVMRSYFVQIVAGIIGVLIAVLL